MEKIVITGNKNEIGKSTLAFNIAYGLAIEGRSVGIIEIYKESSYMADIMKESVEKYKNPQIMQGIIKLMVVSEKEADEKFKTDILNEELWSGVEDLIIEIPFSKKEIIKKIEGGKSLIITESCEELEQDIEKSLEILIETNLENIGIVENRVKEYKREVKSKYDIISRIPVEDGIKKDSYDGIPYIYKNYNTNGIIELKEIVDRIIDFEYGEEESAVKKINVGVLTDKDGEVAENIDKAEEVIIVRINGMLYKMEEKGEFIKEKIDEYGVDVFITLENEQQEIENKKNKNIPEIIENYIEDLNKDKRHSCH